MLDKFRIILYSIFDFAIDNDLCTKNPVKNIKIADNKKEEKNTYTKEQADKLTAHCVTNNILDILILVKTGIRRSELLGLTWDDVNTDEKYIYINSAVTPDEGTSIEDDTK